MFKECGKQNWEARCWIPTKNEAEVRELAKLNDTNKPGCQLCDESNSVNIPKHPTYFILNKFTEVFQTIIDTYGIPG